MPKALITIKREIVEDSGGDSSYLEQDGWEDRLAQFRVGQFGFCGVRAVAEIKVPYGHDFIVTTLKSPGLWSIEDDSGESYFAEVFKEERKTLMDVLESLREFEIVD